MIEEELIAAEALGEMLTSAMLQAHDRTTKRDFLYVWERKGLRWLIRYRDRHPDGSVGNDWMYDFLELNREAILSEDERMDFNLMAFNERRDVGRTD